VTTKLESLLPVLSNVILSVQLANIRLTGPYRTVEFANGQVAISQSQDELPLLDCKLLRSTEGFIARISLKDEDPLQGN
jgi:hypothetical protein